MKMPSLAVVKNNKVLISIVALLVIGGAVGYILSRNNNSSKTSNPEVVYNQETLNKAVKDKDAKTVQEQQAAKRRQDIAKAYQKDDKLKLLLTANTYSGQSNYQKALETYKQYEQQFGLDAGVAASIGDAYRGLNDKKNAIIYYQKSIDIMTKAPVEGDAARIKYYQDTIAELKK